MKVSIKGLVALHQPTNNWVIDCGGYLGEYTEEILKKFDCNVILFEPIPEYAEVCRNKFKDKKVVVIEKAVGEEGTIRISKNKNSSSQFGDGEKIEVESISLNPLIRNIDILKLNCEGAEFEIIKRLNEDNLLKDVKEILVQFHKWVEDPEKSREILSKTHRRIYSFKWDLWVKK